MSAIYISDFSYDDYNHLQAAPSYQEGTANLRFYTK